MASYLVTYDPLTSAHMHEQLIAFVKNNKFITQWSQPFVGCFLIKTDTQKLILFASFREFFGDKILHVVTPIVPSDLGGILPQNIWEWLNQPEISPLSSLFGLGLPKFDPSSD